MTHAAKGFRVSPWGVPLFDYVRKRFSGFNRFGGFNGGGAAHKNIEAPRNIKRGCSKAVFIPPSSGRRWREAPEVGWRAASKNSRSEFESWMTGFPIFFWLTETFLPRTKKIPRLRSE